MKRIIERTKNRFNVSVAEVESQDIRQRAVIGLVVVGNDSSFVNSVIDKMIDFVEEMQLAEMIGTDMEIISL